MRARQTRTALLKATILLAPFVLVALEMYGRGG